METTPFQTPKFHEDLQQRFSQRRNQLQFASQSKNRKQLLTRSRQLSFQSNNGIQNNDNHEQFSWNFSDNNLNGTTSSYNENIITDYLKSSINSSYPLSPAAAVYASDESNSTTRITTTQETILEYNEEQDREETEITERVDAMELEDHSVKHSPEIFADESPPTMSCIPFQSNNCSTFSKPRTQSTTADAAAATSSKHLEQLSVVPQYKIDVASDFIPAKHGPIPPGKRSLIVTQNQISTTSASVDLNVSSPDPEENNNNNMDSSPRKKQAESSQQSEKNKFYSILDCVFNESKQIYQIMDVLVYNDLHLDSLQQSKRDPRLTAVKEFIERSNCTSNVCAKTKFRFEFLNSFNFSPASFQAVNQLDFLSFLSSKSLKQCLSFVINEPAQRIPAQLPMLKCLTRNNNNNNSNCIPKTKEDPINSSDSFCQEDVDTDDSNTSSSNNNSNESQKQHKETSPILIQLICDSSYRLATKDGFLLHQLDEIERKVHGITPSSLVNATFVSITLSKQQRDFLEQSQQTADSVDGFSPANNEWQCEKPDFECEEAFEIEEHFDFSSKTTTAAPYSEKRKTQRKQVLDKWIQVHDFQIEELTADADSSHEIESFEPDSLQQILQRQIEKSL